MAKKHEPKKIAPNSDTKAALRRREVERLDKLEAAAWKSFESYQNDMCCDRFLNIILDTIRRRCDLLGLDTPYYAAGLGTGS